MRERSTRIVHRVSTGLLAACLVALGGVFALMLLVVSRVSGERLRAPASPVPAA